MIGRLVLKSSIFGSVGSAAWLSTAVDIPDNFNNKPLRAEISDKQKRDYSTQQTATVTLEVVEMYQKREGCKIIFTDNFKDKKSYNVRGWFDEKMKSDPKKERTWKDMFAAGLVYEKGKCKKGKLLILEVQGYHKDSFKTKTIFEFRD